jgi:hypothetical protein
MFWNLRCSLGNILAAIQDKLEDIVEIVQACCRLHIATKHQLPIIHDGPIHASRDDNGVLRDWVAKCSAI